MEEENFLKEYIQWRISGIKTNEINSLIHLHFYFRQLQKKQNFKYFEGLFITDEENSKKIESEIYDYDDCPDFGDHSGSVKKKSNIITERENKENNLIIGLINKEEEAYSSLFENEFFKIKEYVIGNSGTLSDAQDLFQEGVIILLEKIQTPGFQLTCKAGTFLYSCCKNLWLNQLRRSRREIATDYYELYDYIEIDVIEQPEDQEEKLKEILSQLSESCLKIIQAFYYELKSWETIAKDLGYNSANSAKNQKYKCLKRVTF